MTRNICLGALFILTTCRLGYSQETPMTRSVVFVSNYMERGDTQSRPRSDQLRNTVAVFAAPGEYEPATISIRAATDLKGVSATLMDDLKTERGDVIAKTAVQIRLVDPFESWTKMAIEMFLLNEQSVDIPAGMTRRFWLTVKVPPDAQPGTYRSRLAVTQRNTALGPDLGRPQTLEMLTYEVTVPPLRLATAAETGMAFFMYNDTAYYPDELITAAYQQRVLEDMREHGMTTVDVYAYPHVDQTGIDLTTGDGKHLGLTETMDILTRAKLPAPGLPVIWIGAECYGPDVWTAVLEERNRRKWPEIVFYAVDEPETEDRNVQVRAFMKGFNAFRRRNPHVPVRVTTSIGSSRGVQTVGHYYDFWIGCMAQETGESGLIADARMMRKELWTYDCMLAPVDAETDRYYFGIWAWVSGVKGCAHWCYYDGKPKLSYVYPTPAELISTIGWEAVREGIDDYRYLFTLKQWTDRARLAGRADLTEGADRLFQEVGQMVIMDNYAAAYRRAAAGNVPDATAYQRPRMEPQLPIEAYDRLRRKVAQEIERLSASLSGPTLP